MNVNLTSPAYPCTPIQDQYNRLVVPNAGINKLEYFALELYKVYKTSNFEIEMSEIIQADYNAENNKPRDFNLFIMDQAINDSIALIELIEKKTKTPENEKTSKLVSL